MIGSVLKLMTRAAVGTVIALVFIMIFCLSCMMITFVGTFLLRFARNLGLL